jgi:hypothetical protein
VHIREFLCGGLMLLALATALRADDTDNDAGHPKLHTIAPFQVYTLDARTGSPGKKSLNDKYGLSVKALCDDYRKWVAGLHP